MSRVGFIGLGIMGGPMAANLVRAGHDVVGFNRSRAAVDRLVEAGGAAAGDVAEAVDGAEFVITSLPDSPDVQTIALDEGGVFDHAVEGTIYIDMSTIAPRVAREIAERGGAQGIGVIDAPVSGGDNGAKTGTLSIMAGGAEHDVARAMPLFEAMGSTIVHVGPAGSGQTVKAANQLIIGATLGVVAEALEFLEASTVDTGAALAVLGGGMAASAILERKAPAMVSGDFQPGFRIDLHHKDLGIALAAAREVGVITPIGAFAGQLLAQSRAQGDGLLDHSAVIRAVDRMCGRDVHGEDAATGSAGG
ncbi:MAG: NAD(P)-dependent oxidoreductase [Mycobacteriales bacterium]